MQGSRGSHAMHKSPSLLASPLMQALCSKFEQQHHLRAAPGRQQERREQKYANDWRAALTSDQQAQLASAEGLVLQQPSHFPLPPPEQQDLVACNAQVRCSD